MGTKRTPEQIARDNVQRAVSGLRSMANYMQAPFSEASAGGAMFFVDNIPLRTTPHISLLENGRLRFMWRDDLGRQLLIVFLDEENTSCSISGNAAETTPLEMVVEYIEQHRAERMLGYGRNEELV